MARRELPMRGGGGGGSALIAGASIAAIELPTAVPYLAVIAAIDASSAGVPQEIGLVALYNVVFVLPLLAIVVVLLVAGERADPWLQKGGAWLQRRWPLVLASLLLLVGGALTVVGAGAGVPASVAGGRSPGTAVARGLGASSLALILTVVSLLRLEELCLTPINRDGIATYATIITPTTTLNEIPNHGRPQRVTTIVASPSITPTTVPEPRITAR